MTKVLVSYPTGFKWVKVVKAIAPPELKAVAGWQFLQDDAQASNGWLTDRHPAQNCVEVGRVLVGFCAGGGSVTPYGTAWRVNADGSLLPLCSFRGQQWHSDVISDPSFRGALGLDQAVRALGPDQAASNGVQNRTDDDILAAVKAANTANNILAAVKAANTTKLKPTPTLAQGLKEAVEPEKVSKPNHGPITCCFTHDRTFGTDDGERHDPGCPNAPRVNPAPEPEKVAKPWALPEPVTVDPHMALKEALFAARAGLNIFCAGPAGTGKTTLAKQLAAELATTFHYLIASPEMSVKHILGGYRLVNGSQIYQESALVAGMHLGGVVCIDEIDNGDPSVNLILNSVLEQGFCTIPDTGETVHKHPSTVFIVCANTWGAGPTAEYVGRSRQDAAFLDRFRGGRIFVDYDESLERKLYDPEVVSMVQALRKACRDKKIRQIVSFRMSAAGTKLKKLGAPMSYIAEKLLVDFTPEERGNVLGALQHLK